jgi:potassium-transporting ATPase ATP-binding subunit
MTAHARIAPRSLFDGAIVRRALRDSVVKLDPRRMIRNPVMFVVEVGSLFTTILFIHAVATGTGEASAGFIGAIALWLWFTVLFANFAEAMAEGRGKAQADSLRNARRDVTAIVLDEATRAAQREAVVPAPRRRHRPRRSGPDDSG